jgi:hypothetical protein
MAKHIPQLAHLRAAAVHDVRKPFFLQPLFTFLSSPTSSAVREYRSVFFERLQNIHVRSAQGFLRSLEWHIDCMWPFLGAAICDWEFPVWTPEERIGWFDFLSWFCSRKARISAFEATPLVSSLRRSKMTTSSCSSSSSFSSFAAAESTAF